MNASGPLRAVVGGHATTLLVAVVGVVVGLLGRSTIGGWDFALVGLLVLNGVTAGTFLVSQGRAGSTPGPVEARSALGTMALSVVFLAHLVGRVWPEHESWLWTLMLVGIMTMACALWAGSRRGPEDDRQR